MAHEGAGRGWNLIVWRPGAGNAFVKNDQIRRLTADLKLGRWLYLGGTELEDKGRGEPKRLGEIREAIIGAIHLDASPAHAAQVLRRRLERYSTRDAAAPT